MLIGKEWRPRSVASEVLNAALLARIRRQGVRVGRDVRLHGSPIVQLADGSAVTVGANTVLTSRSSRTALGVNHPVVLRTLRAGAEIDIGEDVGMSGGSICAALLVKIGDGCLLGANVMICDTDFHPLDSHERRYQPAPVPAVNDHVEIGSNVFIGAGAIILKGVTIGEGAVIGAGSVVSCSVPDRGIAAGSPARLLRTWS